MKTLILSSLVLALGLIGCTKDDDLARPNQMATLFENDITDAENTALNSIANNYCKDLLTEHALIGRGEWADAYEAVDDKYNSLYILKADGQAYLNETELGRSQLTLEYSPVTKNFSGTLFTYFEQITMQHRFVGGITETFDVTPWDSKDPVIIGAAELVRGSMETSLGEFLLRDRVTLNIFVHPSPEGDVDVKVAINGLYCVTDNLFISRF